MRIKARSPRDSLQVVTPLTPHLPRSHPVFRSITSPSTQAPSPKRLQIWVSPLHQNDKGWGNGGDLTLKFHCVMVVQWQLSYFLFHNPLQLTLIFAPLRLLKVRGLVGGPPASGISLRAPTTACRTGQSPISTRFIDVMPVSTPREAFTLSCLHNSQVVPQNLCPQTL